jgi:hypothetical protein
MKFQAGSGDWGYAPRGILILATLMACQCGRARSGGDRVVVSEDGGAGPVCERPPSNPPPAGAHACPGNVWFGDVEIAAVHPDRYKGALLPCSIEEIGDQDKVEWRLTVEGSTMRRYGDDPTYNHTETLIFGRRAGSGGECGLALSIMLKGNSVVLSPGQDIRLVRKRVVRHFEDDVSMSVAIRGENGDLLLGWVGQQRDEVWDRDVFPEFALRTERASICRTGASEGLTLQLTDDGQCWGANLTETCCRLGNQSFTLRTLRATRQSGQVPSEKVDLLLAAPGVLGPPHPP